MVRVSVVTKNDIWKYIIKLGFIIIILIIIVQVYQYTSKNLTGKHMTTEQCISYIAEEITAMGSTKQSSMVELNSEDIIASELRMSMAVSSRNTQTVLAEKADNQDQITDEENSEQENDKEQIQEVSEHLDTEVIQTKYKDTYNFQVGSVKIKNETDYNLQEMNLDTSFSVDNKNVIIYHTHTCESYTPSEQNNYEMEGNYRTTDLDYSVAKVGDELEKYLTSYGFSVIHDKTYHDYPAYTGSYGRSLTTVSNILSKCEKTDILIDLHRDAMGDDSYAPKVKIGDEYAAQIMFVIGTNGSGLEHPNWKHNLEFAIKVQEKANEMYPGLFKNIILRNARYNQHLGEDATIIEFGATGNTLEECEVSAKYLAKVLEEVSK